MRNFWRFHFIKVLLGIVVIQLLFFYWLQVRNHKPVAEQDIVSVYEGHDVKISPLRNDTDEDEDELTLQKIAEPLKGKLEQDENVLVYTAVAGFAGVDSFEYVVFDGKKESKPMYIKVNVEENLKPEANNDKVESYIAGKIPIMVMSNDGDREEDSIFLHEYTDCLHGKIERDGDALIYIPSKKTALVDSFHYTIGDGLNLSDQATVTIVIKDKNDPCYPWLSTDLGSTIVPGSIACTGNEIIVKASGHDIWGNEDHCHFAYQQIKGDFEMITKIKSLEVTDQWAKAGIMVRESPTGSSKNAFIAITGENGITFQQRRDTGSGCNSERQNEGNTAPYWVKIVRKGNDFTGLSSADGKTWKEIGVWEIDMPTTVFLGFGVTSHSDEVLTEVRFDKGKTRISKK